jgi:hypothetical protein
MQKAHRSAHCGTFHGQFLPDIKVQSGHGSHALFNMEAKEESPASTVHSVYYRIVQKRYIFICISSASGSLIAEHWAALAQRRLECDLS